VRNTSTRFHSFVADRLELIHSLSTPNQWRHVPPRKNPADIASRGLLPNKVDVGGLWSDGPSFLYVNENSWLKQPDNVAQLSPDDPELKFKTCSVMEETSVEFLRRLLEQCSTFKAVRHYTVWWLRFKQYFKWKHSGGMPPAKGRLTTDDFEDATTAVIQLVQWDAFPQATRQLPQLHHCEPLDRLLNDKQLRTMSCFQRLKSLSLFILDGVMRVDGRLTVNIP